MTNSGVYIVIEGNDGTGKSTQVDQFASYLRQQQREVTIVEEPGSEDIEKSTPVANYLRQVIKNGSLERAPEVNLALFSAARRELWQELIAPALERGECVLAARNYYSTLAYQGRGEGLDEQHIIETTTLCTDPRYMRPDHLIVLTLEDEKEREARIAGRGELATEDTFESKDALFQQRVNQAYVDLARDHNLTTIACMDADHKKTIDEIQQEVRRAIGL